MYSIFKKCIRFIFPKKWLIQNEQHIRYFYSLFYKGQKYKCHVCNTTTRKFIPLEDGQLICPRCGSNARARRLVELILQAEIKETDKILDFSPSGSVYRLFKNKFGANYISTDLSNEFIADNHFDITTLPIENESVDLIICYHILEHVEDDLTAMKELFRVLKSTGTAFIQTPFKECEIYENALITIKADRKMHFGQEDHVRIYSVDGLSHRLNSVGFKVEILKFEELENNYFGFKNEEFVLKVTKF